MTDETQRICIEIFKRATGLALSSDGDRMPDEEILIKPIGTFDMDSLDAMEFIMSVEDRFSIELDEEKVNGCASLAELVALVSSARHV